MHRIVRRAIRRLQSGDPQLWRRACRTLEKIGICGAPAAPAMVRVLKTAHEELCKSLYNSFREIGAPAVPALVRALNSGDLTWQRRAAHALYMIGPAAVDAAEALAAHLESSDRELLVEVTWSLKAIGFGALRSLVPYAEHEDVWVRRRVLWIIQDSDTLLATATLTRLKDDPDDYIRRNACRVLSEDSWGMDPEVRIEEALYELKHGGTYGTAWACDLLAEAGPAAVHAVPTLIDNLQDMSAHVRGSIYVALRHIGTPALPLLIEALQIDERQFKWRFGPINFAWRVEHTPETERAFKCRVATAFQFFGPDAAVAVKPLVALLKLPDPYLQQAACSSLTAIGEAAIPALRPLFKLHSAGIRRRAALVLGMIGSPKAIPILTKVAAENGVTLAQAYAKKALKRCQSR